MAGLTWDLELLDQMTAAEAYGEELTELGREHEHVVALAADLAKSTKIRAFFDAFPERSFNFGVAEANMMAAAAGMAACGKLPFVNTFAVFASMRACEMVRTDIAYPSANVKIIGTHSGVAFGQAGSTHVCTEDLGIVRTMANMTIVVPADSYEMVKLVHACVEDHVGPLYTRVGRGLEPTVYEDMDFEFTIGKANTMKQGEDLTFIACGVGVLAAVEASEYLEDEGKSARVVDMHTIKPLDREAVISAARETGGIITVEDHNIVNGLGTAVAEVLAEEAIAIRFQRVGIPDEFTQIGYPEELYPYYKLDGPGLTEVGMAMLEKPKP